MNIRPMIEYISREYRVGQPLVGCEVGVLLGGNALSIIHYLPMSRLYLVDRYENYPGYDEYDGKLQEFKEEARKELASAPCEVVWIYEDALDAVHHIHKELDFAYIDTFRVYKYIAPHISAYHKLIKDGGYIGGPGYEPAWEGVIRAVDEFVGMVGGTLHVEPNRGVNPRQHCDWWLQCSNPREEHNIE